MTSSVIDFRDEPNFAEYSASMHRITEMSKIGKYENAAGDWAYPNTLPPPIERDRGELVNQLHLLTRQLEYDLRRAPDNPAYEYHVTIDTGAFRAIGTIRVQNLDAAPLRVPRMTGDALYPEDV